MKKALCIIGSTAVGKTALSLFIAPYLQGVIFSADSIQVYKKLDIISGKDRDLYKDTPVKLLDITSSDYSFNVSDYLRSFKLELESIQSNQTPIIVGGTGFYISALLDEVKTVGVKPNKKLRKILEEKTVLELQEILYKKNPEKFSFMNNSDRNNPRRLIRAIEVANNSKTKLLEKSILADYDILIIGLEYSRERLNKKIDDRVDERLKNGAKKEAEDLFESYSKLSPQIKRANGYRQLFEYFLKNISIEEAVEKWKVAEHQNAKKQMTYFKKVKNVIWFEIEKKSKQEILQYVLEWYNKD